MVFKGKNLAFVSPKGQVARSEPAFTGSVGYVPPILSAPIRGC